jgi:hypothetical protein
VTGDTNQGNSFEDEKLGNSLQVENLGNGMVLDLSKKMENYNADIIGRAVGGQADEKNHISSLLNSGLFYAEKDMVLDVLELRQRSLNFLAVCLN